MKTTLTTVTLIILLTGSAARANDLSFVEKFALAADREEALKVLIPGTPDYYYYHALFAQSQGQQAEVQRLLGTWIKRHGRTARVKEIQNRQALLNYGANPAATLAHLRRELGLSFNHSRVIEGQKPKHPTALDQGLISFEAFRARAFNAGDLSGVEDRGLEKLDAANLNSTRLRYLLSRLRRPDLRDLPALIAKDLLHKSSRGFGSHAIHRQLTLAQMDELLQLNPKLLLSSPFVHSYLTKLAPSDDIDTRLDPVERGKHLNRILQFSRRLAPAFNSLKANSLYNLLRFKRSRGEWDRELFLEYLRLPRPVGYMNAKYREDLLKRPGISDVNLNADFTRVTGMPPIRADEQLVRDYLLQFLREEASTDAFAPFVRDTYLKPLFAETKLVHGVGDPERWFSLLTSAQVKALRDRIDLDFAARNPNFFGPNEPVSLIVNVKNVKQLIVRVFEINTYNFYTKNLAPVDTAVNLDGLAPTRERTVAYDEPPMRRMERTFNFPGLKKRGVYVVEFIGNGRSSRALVTKGALRLLEHVGPAGHEFRVLNETNQPVPQATLWLGGKEYKPAKDIKDGLIIVPFSNRPGRQVVVLRHGGFSTLATFNHLAEKYQLDAGIYVDREALVKGTQAAVIVRPALRLNGHPVSPRVLEDIKLVIHSIDQSGVPTLLETSLAEIQDGDAFVHQFTVPDRLSKITFTVKARVENLALGKKQSLVDSATFSLNQVDQTLKVDNLHLAHLGDVFAIDILGKNGEPKSDRPVALSVKHRDFNNPRTLSLKSAANGRIGLGALRDIEWISATNTDGQAYRWEIARDRDGRIAQPAVLHAAVGDAVRVALPGTPDNQARGRAFALLEQRGGTYMADHLKAGAFRAGFLEITDLPAGNYELHLKDTGETLPLRITEGPKHGGYILSARRLLEQRRLKPLQIQSVLTGQAAAVVQLAHATPYTRVHVFGTRFVPRYSAFAGLDIGGLPTLDARRLGRPRSLYVQERDIGEEYRYILDRKYAPKFPGNMLARPGLLLNPWAIRDTATGEQVAAAGGQFQQLREPLERTKTSTAYRPGKADATVDFSTLDFLAHNTLLLANLKPDKNGVVEIDLTGLRGQQQLHVVAVDPEHTVYRPVSLKPTELAHRENRMVQSLDIDKAYSEQKRFTVLKKGESLKVADITTSQVRLYDTLHKVYLLMVTLSPDKTLVEFEFILRWPGLKPGEKRAKYSQYACHELNFFLYHKDPDFFNAVVKPHLQNKKDKTFMDQWLLGAKLDSYLEPFAFSRLNDVEKILLAKRGTAEPAEMSRYIRDKAELIAPNPEQYNRLFETAIKSAALEEVDELGFAEGKKKAMERFNAQLGLATGEKPKVDAALGRGVAPAPTALTPGTILPPTKNAPTGPASIPSDSSGRTKGGKLGYAQNETHSSTSRQKLNQSEKAQKELSEFKRELNLDRRADKLKGLQEMDGDGRDFFREREKLRRAGRQFYRKLPATKEWAENNYYRLTIAQQNADLIRVNAFWNDFAAAPANQPFFSGNFIYATGNFSEMMLALAVLELPFESPDHIAEAKDRTFQLTADRPVVVCHQEILPSAKAGKRSRILLSQNFFRADSRYRHEGNQRLDNFVDGEFLKQIAYGCQVVLTNPTSSPQKFRVLTQVPEGAIPLNGGEYSKGRTLQLQPYSTTTFDYYFYFPASGDYAIYPVQVAGTRGHIAAADAFQFSVVNELSRKDKTSWAWISQNGTEANVLKYLRDHNLNRLDLGQIAFRLRHQAEGGGGRDFYNRLMNLLDGRYAYHPTLWSYALYHRDEERMRQYLERSPITDRVGLLLESTLLNVNPVERQTYQHLEYKPLVNARAHMLGQTRKILNRAFHAQYHRLMEVLKYRKELNDADLLAAAFYLLLQDRVAEALDFHGRVSADRLATRVQHDYLTLYLAFYQGDLAKARQILGRYKEYPVDRWRNRFAAAASQLAEIEGGKGQLVDDKDRDQKQNQLAGTETSFEFTVEDRQVKLSHQNLKEVTVNYYPMDIELLFSRMPFLKDDADHFTYIVPNTTATVKLPAGKDAHDFPIPEQFHSSNLMIEIVGQGIRKTQAYYANTLAVRMVENYGQVRVAQADGKPLPKPYVKVYGKLANGQVRFYKDGYTDLRG
ncbi:MAG: hypothetical protein VX705_04700, partial [Verrucomicrobiota bacterium]|nr:hypothetical protein [Verrucomicrobiota bacterium]